jgi:hypothetical protein
MKADANAADYRRAKSDYRRAKTGLSQGENGQLQPYTGLSAGGSASISRSSRASSSGVSLTKA